MKRLKAKNLKEQNYIDIVKLLKIGNYSRADLAYNLELSKASISVLVDDLINMGIVYEKCDGESSSLGGKKPILLDINKNIGYFIAVHFRSELCNIAVVNLKNEIIEESSLNVNKNDDYRITFNPIIKKIKELKNKEYDHNIDLNNNNFIGDFDIEYLLTKNGNFRLKAYNRYNDQNYYTRNSLTTQGVGIVFKHDFDKLFRRRHKKEPVLQEDSGTTVIDSTSIKRLPVKRPSRK